MKNESGKIITVTGSNGGCGKSITTFVLACIYSSLGKKVLMIDLDLYNGSLSLITNTTSKQNIYNYVDDLKNNRFTSVDDYTTKVNENIYLLASVKDPRQASKIEYRYLETILKATTFSYDIVLVDTTYLLNDINVITLDITDTILYVINNDTLSLKGAKTFFTIMKDISKTNIKVLLNNAISPDKRYYSNYDIKTIINHNIDYIIDKSNYVKNIDKFIMDKTLINNKILFRDYNRLKTIALDLESRES